MKVVIELEFDAMINGRKVLNCDFIWDYLEELIEDESLDYTVYDGDIKLDGGFVLDYQEKT